MDTIITTCYVIVCVCLIAIVLFQVGKGASLSGFLGGGSSDALLSGASGTSLIKKITAGFAIGFMCLALILSVISAKRPKRSLMDIMPPAPVIPETDILGGKPVQETAQEQGTAVKTESAKSSPAAEKKAR
ncbi:preprotein translocase subunit SecG [bacterium]